MANKRFSGLDELMIINPGVPNTKRHLRLRQVFSGEDGRLYQLKKTAPLRTHHSRQIEGYGNMNDRYFLGDDGILYQSACKCSRNKQARR